jgi:hypothetical protein
MDERYKLTEDGIAIKLGYTWVLFGAQEATDLMHWMLWHLCEIEKRRRKQLEAVPQGKEEV